MNSNQEAKLGMYLKVQQFLTEKLTALTALFSIITIYKTSLDDFITDILEADALATADTTGYTEAKQTKRAQMTELALRVSGGGAAYYKLQDDSGSQNEIFFNASEFTRANDTEVYTHAMQVYRLANAAGVAGAALAPHGITTTEVSNLNVKAQQYLAILELPKRKVSAKGAQVKKVVALMADTDDLLNETLDAQMRVLKGTADNDLFDEYEGNRGIDDNPTGGGSGTDAVREGDVIGATVIYIDLTGVTPTPATEVVIEITGNAVQLYASTAPGIIPVPAQPIFDVAIGAVTKTIAEFATLTGLNTVGNFLNIRNVGVGPSHYKITFTNVE